MTDIMSNRNEYGSPSVPSGRGSLDAKKVDSIPSRPSTFVSRLEARAEAETGEVWASTLQVLAAAFVAALFVGVFTYYLTIDQFAAVNPTDTTRQGYFYNMGWVSSAGGFLVYLLILLFSTVAATTLGLGFRNYAISIAVAIGVSIVISVVFYWAFDAATRLKSGEVVAWSLVLLVLGVGAAVLGWMYAKKNAADFPASKGRINTTMWMLGGEAVLALVLILAMSYVYERVNKIVDGSFDLVIPTA